METNRNRDIDFTAKQAKPRPGSAFYLKDFLDDPMPLINDQVESARTARIIASQIEEIIDQTKFDQVFHRDWGDDRNA